jgi:hypothetical protein
MLGKTTQGFGDIVCYGGFLSDDECFGHIWFVLKLIFKFCVRSKNDISHKTGRHA